MAVALSTTDALKSSDSDDRAANDGCAPGKCHATAPPLVQMMPASAEHLLSAAGWYMPVRMWQPYFKA